jgi:hypothetical protein
MFLMFKRIPKRFLPQGQKQQPNLTPSNPTAMGQESSQPGMLRYTSSLFKFELLSAHRDLIITQPRPTVSRLSETSPQ